MIDSMLRSRYIGPIIVLLYSVFFFQKSTATPISAFVHVAILAANMVGLLFAASAGIIVNHMVRISNRCVLKSSCVKRYTVNTTLISFVPNY